MFLSQIERRRSHLPLSFAVAALLIGALVQLAAAPSALARDVEVTRAATRHIESRVYVDNPDACVVLSFISWTADAQADDSATVHYSTSFDEKLSKSGVDPFDDKYTWLPGMDFRVPAGSHWIQLGASYSLGSGDCSELEAKARDYMRGPYTVTFKITQPDPATIVPLGRTIFLNRAGKAAVAVVRCPFDGAGSCPVVVPRTTTLTVNRKRYTFSVASVRRVPRGKSAIVYVGATRQVRAALEGRTLRPRVFIQATKPGTRTVRRSVARSISIR